MSSANEQRRVSHGFALVEALVIVLAASIVVSLVAMLILGQTQPTRSEECYAEAERFQNAVTTWHENDTAKVRRWPGVKENNNVPTLREVVLDLEERRFPITTEHIDGMLRSKPTDDKGWYYDPKTHVVNDYFCR
jgi:hypothetical protein